MTSRRAAAVGGAVSFVVAGVAGVLGGQITKDAMWTWFAFAAVLMVGALVTAWAAHRAVASDDSARSPSRVRHIGSVRVDKVSGGKGSQVAGVNYGTMNQTHHDEDP